MTEAEDDSEQRRKHRANLFLAAMIEAGGVESPVRIRNLSETGALLEGPAFPAKGAKLVLKRQEVKVDATVRWIAGPRCGVEFGGQVAVQDWVAGKTTPRFGQGHVDAVQAAVRAGASLNPQPAKTEEAGVAADARIAEELAYLQRLLETMSAELIHDPAIVARHMRVLQSFDVADQILGHLAAILKADDREAAIRAIGMEELRARLLRRPLEN